MRLVIHIGAAKCGSTSIQLSLAENALILRESGVLVPDTQLGVTGTISGDQVSFFQDLWEGRDSASIVAHRLLALRDHMQRERLGTAIISAENLIISDLYAGWCAPALTDFDEVEVIAYIRRQDDYLLAAWRQWWLKLEQFSTFEGYLEEVVGLEADWNRLIKPWEDAFGVERIRVRRFQRDDLVNHDVVDDFFEFAGFSSCDYRRVDVANPTVSDALIDLAFDVRNVFSSIHDDRFFMMAYQALGTDVLKNGQGSWFLTLDERLDILSRYEQSNAEMRRKYFPQLADDQPLFTLPTNRDVRSVSAEERKRTKDDLALRLLTALVKAQIDRASAL